MFIVKRRLHFYLVYYPLLSCIAVALSVIDVVLILMYVINAVLMRAGTAGGDWEREGGTTLVIVESPAKARTIEKFLTQHEAAGADASAATGTKYIVDSCMGHIRSLAQTKADLPAECKKKLVVPQLGVTVADLSVDVENRFTPLYVELPDKKPVIKRLRSLAKSADRILLATDEDREGEAISWHLLQVLQPTVPYKVCCLSAPRDYNSCFCRWSNSSLHHLRSLLFVVAAAAACCCCSVLFSMRLQRAR